jgi:electron transfer flavoprotein alpha subunit
MAVLLLAEVSNGKLNDATAKALTAAKALNEPVHVLVAGERVEAAARAAAGLDGIEKVLVADDPVYAHQLAEPLAALLVGLAGNYSAILAAATSTGKNVMPRVAALLDVMQISEIIKVTAPDTFERPIYAGNAIETVQSTDAKKVITVRTAAFQSKISPPPPRPRFRVLRMKRSPNPSAPSLPRPGSSYPAAAACKTRTISRP